MKRIAISLFSVIVVGVVAFAASLYYDVSQTFALITEDQHRSQAINPAKEPFNIALIGINSEVKPAKTDANILVQVLPKQERTIISNIPGEQVVNVGNTMNKTRMNKVYAQYGLGNTLKTFENVEGETVNYYIRLNFNGFVSVIDELGGITVRNESAFSFEGETFAKGRITLNGEQALKYARAAEEGVTEDADSLYRQKQVAAAIIQKVKSPAIIKNYKSILEAINNSVRTNLTFEELADIVRYARPAAEKIQIR
ncbi:MAG: LCP family protein [Bacilli bacterium]